MSKPYLKILLKKISLSLEKLRSFFVIQLDFLKCRFLKINQIIAKMDGDIELSSKKRLCIFSHFDKYNKIDPYVVNYLQSLFSIQCAIVFVSTCSELSAEDILKVKPYVSKIILRKNFGLDFGSWKKGLSYVKDIHIYSQIILGNDSVYGPLFDLNDAFCKMKKQHVDIWGVTDSEESAYHLQSYFLVFNNQRAISFFTEFWKRFKFVENKQYIINHYEVGLSQKALQKKLRIKAYCEYSEIRKKYSLKNENSEVVLKKKFVFNPMHHFWKIIIDEFKCPFIKIELLRDNPFKIHDINSWPYVLKKSSTYNQNLIINHLNRIK